MTFSETLTLHLESISKRDFKTFLSTISEREELSLLTLSGEMTVWRVDFVERMESWFADPDWIIQFEVLRVYETAEMGFALLYVGYNDIDAEGTAFHLDYFLNLIFALEDGSWRLVHDQNTFADSKTVETEDSE